MTSGEEGVSNVVQAVAGGIVTRDEQAAFFEMDKKLRDAIDCAKAAGVPQGFIVAVLYGYAQQQTNLMLGDQS